MTRRSLRTVSALLLSAVSLLAIPGRSEAALQMDVITAYNFVVDSNVESPSSYGPAAAHLGVKITNTGATTLTNVVVNLGDLTDAGTGAGTPGVFPSRTVSVTGAGAYSGTFSLEMPSGPADAVRTIPSLAPGETVTQYFFITYPRKDLAGNSVAGEAPVVSDDLWLEYDFWASATEGASTLRTNQTTRVTMRNEISAMANKVSPNTTSKVPNEYLNAFELALGWRPTDGSPRVPGAYMSEGVWYDFGTVGAGFDNNGDLIPDRNAWIQPVGDPLIYSATNARLVKAYGIIVVKLNDGTEKIIPFEDQLYFGNLPANNTGAVGFVYYEYMPLTSGTQVTITPYQEVASGYDNEKFNGDFGAGTTVIPVSSPSPLTLDKTGSPSVVTPGNNATFTMTATNTGATTAIGQPSLGLPFAIEDTIPANLVYVANTADDYSSIPSGMGLSISWYNGSVWSTTEPAAATVTKIRWTLTGGGLEPGASLSVGFQATVPVSYASTTLQNTAIAKTGEVGVLATDSTSLFVAGNNSIGNLVWLDADRDGVQDGTEAGISGIKVSLYYDLDNDGVLDATDPLYAVSDTDSSATALSSDSSNYLFSSLPDAKYIVVVDKLDAQLPLGAILYGGTSTQYAISLDPAHATTSPVDYLTADWPFIIPLEVVKRTSPAVYDEGDLVTYSIDLENWASAVPALQKPVQTAYTTSTITARDAAVQFPAKASGAPDNSFARIDFNAATDWLEFNQGASATAWDIPIDPTPITSVQLVLRGYLSAALTDDDLDVGVYSGTTLTSNVVVPETSLNALVGTSKDLTITLTGTYTWAQLKGLRFRMTMKKTSANDGPRLWVDSVALKVTSTTTPQPAGTYGDYTFLTLPLEDTYNNTQLQFVSAIPQPTSTSSNGTTGTLTWADLGTINPGVRKTVEVTFRALNPSAATQDFTNTATSTGGKFVSGQTINTDSDAEVITVTRKGEIGDFIWWDMDADGVQDVGEPGLANVKVTLDNGAVAYTDEFGYYLFPGLDDATYVLTVDTTTLPFSSFTQTYNPTETPTQASANVSSSVISGNSSDLTRDFGFDSTQNIISGTLFYDNDGDGTQDPGENYIVGATVTLTIGATTYTTTTDAYGFYQFGALADGTYTITVTAPAGTTQTLDPAGPSSPYSLTYNVAASGGNNYPNNDFAFKPSGALALGDTLYNDWDGDGTKDTGDTGIAGVTVWLYEDSNGDGMIDSATDALVATSVTDASGVYGFSSLPAAHYIVVVDTSDPQFPATSTQTQDYDTVRDSRAAVNLTTTNLDVDFGYEPHGTATIGDMVFVDGNNNGLSDAGETGIAAITVRLYFDADGDGAYNAAVDALIGTTETDANGNYLFTDLPAGKYLVDVDRSDSDLPASYKSTTDSVHAATLTAGQNYVLADFGFAPSATIGDTVFYDLNSNGGQDWNETGISGVTVKLYTSTGTLVATTTTDSSGKYQFTGLDAGTYYVLVDSASAPLSGLTQTADPDRDGVPSTDTSYPSLPAADHKDSDIVLGSGATYSGADFGYLPPVVIGDFVWFDLDRDGVQDGDEMGIANVLINIKVGATLYTSVTTDFDGLWNVAGIPDNTYTIQIDASNFAPGGPLEGLAASYDPDGGTTSPTDSGSFTLTSGVVSGVGNLGLDFGYSLTGTPFTLSGTVVSDDSGDSGTADNAAEYEVANLPVYLYNDTTGEFLGETTTDANGDYAFSGLPNGTYRVVIGTQTPVLEGATLTTTDLTNADNNTSITSVTSSATAVRQTVVISGADVPNVDFAFIAGLYDFGDLPAAYGMTLLPQDGARHTIGNYYLGTTPDGEIDGTQSATATGDGADEDGVTFPLLNSWTNGTNGGSMTVDVTTPGSAGYLVAWIDWNNDGDFLDSGEMVVNQAVPNGQDQVIAFDIPASTITSGVQSWYSRVRLFTEAPVFPLVSYVGAAENGEVEDYYFIRGVGTITGSVKEDTDNDNVGDTAIAGVTLTLLNNDGTVYDSDPVTPGVQAITTTTDASGNYTFTNVPAGTWAVGETQPSGYLDVTDADGGTNLSRISNITVTAGATASGNDFVEEQPGAISGTVSEDTDNDDTADQPIAGVELTLTNSDGTDYDSDPNTPGVQTVTTTTDASGNYSFTNLPAGTYGVHETQPSGFVSVSDKDGGNLNEIRPITVTAGATNTGNDFLEEPAPAYSITGRVQEDTDNDDEGDIPIAGVTLTLYADANGDGVADGTALATTTTDATGLYQFTGLSDGKYLVVETQPSSYLDVTDKDGGDLSKIYGIELTPAATSSTGNDFVEELPATISGSVLQDTDNNDTGDTAMSGVTVTLYTDPNGDGDPADGTAYGSFTTTDASGAYSFTGLPAGHYVVVETQPSGYLTVTDGGTADANDPANTSTTDNRIPVGVYSGETDADNNFIEELPGTISGSVALDTNNDGAGDEDFGGVTLALYTDPNGDGDPSDGVSLGTVLSNGLGSYSFTSVPPGYYVVVQTQPAGYLTVSDSSVIDGSDPANGSTTDNWIPVHLTGGETDASNDFVEEEAASISGTVYKDTNGDTTGDAGLQSVTLTLLNGNGSDYDSDPLTPGTQLLTATTAADGTYSFTNLPPGDYLISETQPASYLTVTDTAATDVGGALDAANVSTTDNAIPVSLAAGEADSGNDFVERFMECPNTWTNWQTEWVLADETLGGNSDGDMFNNLLEYAFCLEADNGAGSTYCLVPSATTGKVDLAYFRTAGGATDVLYELEYTSSLSMTTSWTVSTKNIEEASAVSGSEVTVTYDPAGTETVLIKDLAAFTGLTSGFARLKVTIDPDGPGGNDPVVTATEVSGWTENALTTTCRTGNMPYVSCPVFSGTVDSIDGANAQKVILSDSSNGFDLSTVLVDGAYRYYMEITSGAYEGQRFDITASGVDFITLANDTDIYSGTAGNSTYSGAPPAGLASATFVIRKHQTLGSIFQTGSFTAGADRSLATNLQFYMDAWAGYWLKAGATDTWVLTGDGTNADQGGAILPPGYGFFVQSPSAGGTFLTFGKVRENDFIRPLARHSNLMGGGYPVDQSAAGTSGRAMLEGGAPTENNDFSGTLDFKLSDQFLIWRGEDVTATGYDTYYLLNKTASPAMLQWVKVGDASLASYNGYDSGPDAADTLFRFDRSVFIDRKDATLPYYLIPAPWIPGAAVETLPEPG